MTNKPVVALDPAQRYTVIEACALLRCSRGHLYKLINADQLRVIREGKRTYVPGTEIVARSRID
jgi:excisionase family DNA binding protein